MSERTSFIPAREKEKSIEYEVHSLKCKSTVRVGRDHPIIEAGQRANGRDPSASVKGPSAKGPSAQTVGRNIPSSRALMECARRKHEETLRLLPALNSIHYLLITAQEARAGSRKKSFTAAYYLLLATYQASRKARKATSLAREPNY